MSEIVSQSVNAPITTISEPLSSFRGLISIFFEDRSVIFALAVILLLFGLAVLGPVFWGIDPTAVDVSRALEAPSIEHLMGTDGAGRDVFARFYVGARISLTIGFIVVTFGAIIGAMIGLIAGTSAAWLDNLLMRLMDAILAFPPLILAMTVTIGLGVGLQTAAIGIIITSVPWYARMIRSEVIRVRSLPFIEAAVAIGASRARIIGRHVIPHVFSTLLIQASTSFGFAILTLAALGFVGLGAQIPTPEWGAMITEGLGHAITGRWWTGVFPGLGVLLAVTATNILADRTRDLLDPRGTLAK